MAPTPCPAVSRSAARPLVGSKVPVKEQDMRQIAWFEIMAGIEVPVDEYGR